jgi:hypothetical protein
MAQAGNGGQAGGGPAGGNGEAGSSPAGAAGQGAAGLGAAGENGAAGAGAGAGGASPDGGAAGMGGGSDAGPGEGGASAPSAGPFACTMVLGLFTTSQWFNGTNPGGASKTFLQQDGIDPKKWEAKLQKYSFVEKWADPKNGVWQINVATPCATGATTPDRVLFVGYSPDTKHDQPTIQALLEKVIANIKATYPSAKEIDLLTMGRAPGNMMCPNNSDTNTVVGAYFDDAIKAIADASNGLIVPGPKYYVPDCQNSYIFANDTDYTTTAANAIAIQVAAYYAAHP